MLNLKSTGILLEAVNVDVIQSNMGIYISTAVIRSLAAKLLIDKEKSGLGNTFSVGLDYKQEVSGYAENIIFSPTDSNNVILKGVFNSLSVIGENPSNAFKTFVLEVSVIKATSVVGRFQGSKVCERLCKK